MPRHGSLAFRRASVVDAEGAKGSLVEHQGPALTGPAGTAWGVRVSGVVAVGVAVGNDPMTLRKWRGSGLPASMCREGIDISVSPSERGIDMASGARIAPLERVNSPVPFCPKTLLRKKPAGEKGAAGRCPRAGSPQSLRQGLWIVDRDPVCLHFVHVLGRG